MNYSKVIDLCTISVHKLKRVKLIKGTVQTKTF